MGIEGVTLFLLKIKYNKWRKRWETGNMQRNFKDSTMQLAMNSEKHMIQIAENHGVHTKNLLCMDRRI